MTDKEIKLEILKLVTKPNSVYFNSVVADAQLLWDFVCGVNVYSNNEIIDWK